MIPANVSLAPGSLVETSYSFSRCRSLLSPAVTLGEGASAYKATRFDLGPNAQVRVGRYALLHGVRFICSSWIDIGDHALLSWEVVIMDTYGAALDPQLRRSQLMGLGKGALPGTGAAVDAAPVSIGAAVWVGFGCSILPGVTIGEGAIVGARSVVFEDVPAGWLAAGNPARPVRRIDGSVPGSTPPTSASPDTVR